MRRFLYRFCFLRTPGTPQSSDSVGQEKTPSGRLATEKWDGNKKLDDFDVKSIDDLPAYRSVATSISSIGEVSTRKFQDPLDLNTVEEPGLRTAIPDLRPVGGRLISSGKNGEWINCIIQILFHIKVFRNAVHQISISHNNYDIVGALKLVFHKMEADTSPAHVGMSITQLATRREGDHIQEIDAFLSRLLHNVRRQAKATGAMGDKSVTYETLNSLFLATAKRSIDAVNVKYKYEGFEDFLYLPLRVLGCHDLNASLNDYFEDSSPPGNAQWSTGPQHGLQDVRIRYKLDTLPDVLIIQLQRWHYCPKSRKSARLFDRHEYPASFDASPWMTHPLKPGPSSQYQLFGVLSIDYTQGTPTYTTYLRPELRGSFHRFRNTEITEVKMDEVLDQNFGQGRYVFEYNQNCKKRLAGTNTCGQAQTAKIAYLLMYVRKTRAGHVFQWPGEDELDATGNDDSVWSLRRACEYYRMKNAQYCNFKRKMSRKCAQSEHEGLRTSK